MSARLSSNAQAAGVLHQWLGEHPCCVRPGHAEVLAEALTADDGPVALLIAQALAEARDKTVSGRVIPPEGGTR